MSELHDTVFEIIRSNSNNGLFDKGRCFLKNEEIFEMIAKKDRPSNSNYITIVLNKLEKKKILKKETKSVVGHQGLKRVITIL